MTTDLFLKNKSKQEQLAEWMQDKKFFATHDVIAYGLRIFYNRANRTKQDFWKKGLIRTLTDFEKHSWGFNCKDDCYIWIGNAL